MVKLLLNAVLLLNGDVMDILVIVLNRTVINSYIFCRCIHLV